MTTDCLTLRNVSVSCWAFPTVVSPITSTNRINNGKMTNQVLIADFILYLQNGLGPNDSYICGLTIKSLTSVITQSPKRQRAIQTGNTNEPVGAGTRTNLFQTNPCLFERRIYRGRRRLSF